MPIEIHLPVPIVVNTTDGHFQPYVSNHFGLRLDEGTPVEDQIQEFISIGLLKNKKTLRQTGLTPLSTPPLKSGNIFCVADILDGQSARINVMRRSEGVQTDVFGINGQGLPVRIPEEQIPFSTDLDADRETFALMGKQKADSHLELYAVLAHTSEDFDSV